jgi:hypothetical protein
VHTCHSHKEPTRTSTITPARATNKRQPPPPKPKSQTEGAVSMLASTIQISNNNPTPPPRNPHGPAGLAGSTRSTSPRLILQNPNSVLPTTTAPAGRSPTDQPELACFHISKQHQPPPHHAPTTTGLRPADAVRG